MARAWTTAEVKYLAQHYGREPVTVIAAQLGRSDNAIRLYARKSGLSSRLCHERRHDYGNIQELIDFGYHATQIASQIGVTTKCLYNMIRDRLGGHAYAKLKRNTQLQRAAGRSFTPIYCQEQ